jgi:hypothetical protein
MRYNNFLKYFGIGFAFILGITFTVNYLFDPLWYFGGNKIQNHNYAFNERLSKLNLLKEDDYNCLIFGSSRTTFLKASQLSNANCFNMAFSGGTIDEFIDFAELIKSSFDFKIDYLIVGVDVINFFKRTKPKKFNKAKLPPNFLITYLSIDSLIFSKRLFFEQTGLPRIYNSDFEITVINKLPKFNTSGSLPGSIKGIFDKNIIDKYIELNNILNPVKTIYYVPPLSAWHIEDAYRNELLEDYTSAIYSFTENDLNIVDYSSISETTLEPSNTYDGHHYLPRISALIGNDLNEILINIKPANDKFGLQVNNYSYEQYLEDYLLKVKTNFNK